MGRYDFEGYARGWFVACFSHELAPGDVKPLHYFGKDLVLFRTDSGEARLLDAHCPHLGAHLGHGGRVEGEDLVCPFHAWRFDGTGKCVDIPYATKIPKRAEVACWPIQERNGMVFVWHDEDKAPPTWEIPELDGWDGGQWTPWTSGELFVDTHPREIVENVVDIGHFIPVHGTHIREISNVFEDHTAAQINKGTAYPVGGGKDHYELTATYYGPAYQVTDMRGYLHSRLVNCHTPISRKRVHLRFAVSVLPEEGKKIDQAFLHGYAENLRLGFFQDIHIWEHMKFRDIPVLCAGDGPLIKLREWYLQFFSSAQEAARG